MWRVVIGGTVMVNPIPDLPQDFIRGVDVSMLYQIEELGGRYYDNGVQKDCLQILKDHGVNWIRLRIWNDPTDEKGAPLGGGNCDYTKMAEIAQRAKSMGLKVLLDFHYSDWWADPGKQNKPKEWVDLHGDELAAAIAEFTEHVLRYMEKCGALPDMVQLGNEVNNGFLWPDGQIVGSDAGGFDGFVKLLNAAIRATRKVNPGIKIVIHLADGGKNSLYRWFFDQLIRQNVDFDIIGASYYPYWHGTLEDLANNLNDVAQRYRKDVVVLETAYPWTLADADGHPNIFESEEMALVAGYKATVQGQATFLRDLMEVVNSVPNDHGLGIFYWGGEWIPVKGAGWKTGEGNPWENQALFDFEGNALPSLDVFRLVYQGTYTEPEVVEVLPLEIEIPLGEPPKLPETVKVVFSDDSIKSLPVQWSKLPSQIVSTPGEHEIYGYTIKPKISVTAKLIVTETENYVQNPSFETGELSPWQVTGDVDAFRGVKREPQNAHEGEYAFNYWLDKPFHLELHQTVTGLPAGTYKLSMWVQGGGGENLLLLKIEYDGEEKGVEVETTGWQKWKNPTIEGINITGGRAKISVIIDGNAGNWGWIDQFELRKVE